MRTICHAEQSEASGSPTKRDPSLRFPNRDVPTGWQTFGTTSLHNIYKDSKHTKNWIAKHEDDIRLFFLPGYSPELNPDELLNQDVKSNAIGRKRTRNVKEMLVEVRRFLWSRQRRPHLVKKYFHEKHVRYAAT